MVLRTFVAFDNENLIVTSSPKSSLVGNPIINNGNTPNGTIFQYTAGSGEVITLNDTGGNSNVFEDSRANQHRIVDGKGLVANGTRVESESIIRLQQLDDNGSTTGPVITVNVYSKNGNFSDIWGYSTTTVLQDGASYVKVSGSNNGASTYNSFAPCFADGTRIDTPDGDISVEEIKAGQEIWTKDSGAAPVRWVASTTVAGQGDYAPVIFEAGAFGNDRALVVSQQHRMWAETPMAELLFGKPQVLIAAKHLVGLPGVRIEPRDTVRYTHFMFDSHQIVRASGALSESFFYAEQSVGALEVAPRGELQSLFPSLAAGYDGFGATASMTLTATEATALRPYLAA
ncbi:Hint domain-containing protein [Roseobacter sinensis]|uniref:Hint domain-containing protein n=1 Tax=Roseobacter sinensis TaxID=2931391 RepID=A0ABT3BBJ8_9RHOB|nr:Hint domain-containing protein [Roseobacter sp. WL0113]MCV3270949.1 Hint domain-containing protein [Roseobacter sp. WL0113]